MAEKDERELVSRYKLIGRAAVACFIFGILLCLIVIFKYYGHKAAQDIATILTGSAGLVFVVGSSLLFGYTIFQTKHEIRIQIKEMQKSNDTFEKQYHLSISQQYRNTFFSLLENHAKLVSTLTFEDKQGYEGLNIFAEDAKQTLEEYYSNIEDKVFIKPAETECFPNYDYSESMDSLISIVADLYTIVQYVDEFLKDDLYYKITNNFLSVSEKFAIGLYCNFHHTPETKFFAEHKFNFLSYYEPYRKNFDTENYFPVINIEWDMGESQVLMEGHPIHCFAFKIVNVEDLFDCPLVLKDISLSVTIWPSYEIEVYTKKIDINLQINDEEVVSSLNSLVGTYFDFAKNDGYGKIRLAFSFLFEYNKLEYLIGDNFTFERDNIDEWMYSLTADTKSPPRPEFQENHF